MSVILVTEFTKLTLLLLSLSMFLFSFLFFSIPLLSPCSPHSHLSCPRHHIQVSRSHRKVLSRKGRVEQLPYLGTADGKSICLTGWSLCRVKTDILRAQFLCFSLVRDGQNQC